MSVSMADTDGRSFENPTYVAGEQLGSSGKATATSAPGGTNKVSKQKPLH